MNNLELCHHPVSPLVGSQPSRVQESQGWQGLLAALPGRWENCCLFFSRNLFRSSCGVLRLLKPPSPNLEKEEQIFQKSLPAFTFHRSTQASGKQWRWAGAWDGASSCTSAGTFPSSPQSHPPHILITFCMVSDDLDEHVVCIYIYCYPPGFIYLKQ